MGFKNLYIRVLWVIVVLELEGLKEIGYIGVQVPKRMYPKGRCTIISGSGSKGYIYVHAGTLVVIGTRILWY